MLRKFTLVLSIWMLITTFAIAHPPRDLNAEFDLERNMLVINLTHVSGGKDANHYISEIVVNHNGENVIAQRNTRQLGNRAIYLYFMPSVDVGDTIKVTAICNVSGKKEFEFKVE